MYDKTVWIDHIADPNTGEVLQQGTRFDQQKMNNIENGIYDAHMSLQELEDSKVKEFAITLAADQWINNSYTIQNSLLTANTSGRLIMGVNSDQAFAELKAARISKSAVLSNGSLAISASGIVPIGNINLILQIKSTSTSEFIIDLPSDGGDADTLGKKEPAYFASKADYLALLQRIETTEMELEKKISKNMSMQFCLPLATWNENNQQTLLCDKYKTNSNLVPMYLMPLSNVNACTNAGISIIANTETTITFECSNIPTTDLIIAVSYQGESDTWYEVLEDAGEKEIKWYTEEMLPDPHVLFLANAENDNYNDKSMYKNVITKKEYGSLSTIPDITSSSNTWSKFFKGNACLLGKSTYWNKDHGYEISNINNFDPTKEWQISFSAGHRDFFNGASTPLATCLYFDGLGFGIKSYGYRELRLYYRNNDGTETYTAMSVDNSKEYSFHVRMVYKQIDGVWTYVYEISIVNSSNVITTKSYSLPTKQITAADTFTLKYCGYAWTTINDMECGSYFCLDDILLKDIVEDIYKIPTINVREDGYPETTLTRIEHTSIITVTDNTILRHNTDGTVDKYDVVESIPIPYTDSDKTMLLLHCDDKVRSDSLLDSSKRIGSITYNCDISTETKRLGTGSFSFNGINQNIVLNNSNSCFVYPNNYTLDFWLYLDELPIAGSTYGLALFNTKNGYGSTYYDMISLEINPNGSISYCNYYYSESSSDRTSTLSKDPLKAKTWHHITIKLTKMSNTAAYEYTFSVQVDGSGYGKSQNFYNFKTIEIGSNRHSGKWLKGYIDEVRLYDGSTDLFTLYEDVKGWVRL